MAHAMKAAQIVMLAALFVAVFMGIGYDLGTKTVGPVVIKRVYPSGMEIVEMDFVNACVAEFKQRSCRQGDE